MAQKCRIEDWNAKGESERRVVPGISSSFDQGIQGWVSTLSGDNTQAFLRSPFPAGHLSR